MKDLALLILHQIPKYFSDFIKCLAGPKGFARARSDDNQQALAEAMTFLGISFAFCMLLYWPLMPAQVESARFVVGRGLLYLIMAAVGTALTVVSWRCVGGRAPFGRFFVINCYYLGVGIVCQTLIHLCAFGVVKIFDLELYPVLVDTTMRIQVGDTRLTDMLTGPGGRRHLIVYLIFIFIMLVITPFAVIVWSFLGWGAFREINGLSKRRSLAAGVIAFFGSFLIFPFIILIQYVTE